VDQNVADGLHSNTMSTDELRRAAALLRSGGCIAFPTETVYGLGADATNPIAVARIFEIKRRPTFDPLIVHLADADQLSDVASTVPAAAVALARCFWPGPLTIVLPKKNLIPDLVTAGLGSVAVRVPAHALARQLIETAAVPVAAPSANPFGYISPTTAEHVREQLGSQVDLILDGGPCEIGIESTIVSLLGDYPEVLRSGGISLEELRAVFGRIEIAVRNSPRLAPGQLERHYAPRTPLRLVDTVDQVPPVERSRGALLALRPHREGDQFAAVEILSEHGDLREAAANLFAALRRLDRGGRPIYALPVTEDGIGRAIMDRLHRAAT
jgi:L-threonylcarbamoyladenylate synthase